MSIFTNKQGHLNAVTWKTQDLVVVLQHILCILLHNTDVMMKCVKRSDNTVFMPTIQL